MPAWDLSDLTLPEVATTESGSQERRLALTILFHPDVARIGEVASITPGSGAENACLSRREPGFAAPRNGGQEHPLQDRYLSRSPVLLRWQQGGLLVTPPASGSSLKIDGYPCDVETRIGSTQLENGVVLGLAHRLVLLLHWQTAEPTWPDDCGLVGEHPTLQRLRALVSAVAERDTSVLLLGESGTGKELLARAIHARSERRERELVSVNVAAIPAELAAAELFGVRRGAFTGAEADRSGYFGAADGGTLFLDEIGACDPGIQPQLLRALQQGEIQSPGGGTRRVDVRILAATDANLDDQFSKALRYRLGGVEMSLPPLRERREDIGRLLRHFLPATVFEETGNTPAAMTRWADLVTRLALHDWPGNVRELANICQRLELGGQDPLREIVDALHGAASSNARAAATRPAPSDEQVCDALLAARWEVAKAARELRISRQALYRRMEAIPQLRTAADIPSAEITSAYYACEGDLERAALQLQVSRTALRRRWRALDLPAGGW